MFLIFKLISTGGEIRTPINGFGDRYSAIELRPYSEVAPHYQLQTFYFHNRQKKYPRRKLKAIPQSETAFSILCCKGIKSLLRPAKKLNLPSEGKAEIS